MPKPDFVSVICSTQEVADLGGMVSPMNCRKTIFSVYFEGTPDDTPKLNLYDATVFEEFSDIEEVFDPKTGNYKSLCTEKRPDPESGPSWYDELRRRFYASDRQLLAAPLTMPCATKFKQTIWIGGESYPGSFRRKSGGCKVTIPKPVDIVKEVTGNFLNQNTYNVKRSDCAQGCSKP